MRLCYILLSLIFNLLFKCWNLLTHFFTKKASSHGLHRYIVLAKIFRTVILESFLDIWKSIEPALPTIHTNKRGDISWNLNFMAKEHTDVWSEFKNQVKLCLVHIATFSISFHSFLLLNGVFYALLFRGFSQIINWRYIYHADDNNNKIVWYIIMI